MGIISNQDPEDAQRCFDDKRVHHKMVDEREAYHFKAELHEMWQGNVACGMQRSLGRKQMGMSKTSRREASQTNIKHMEGKLVRRKQFNAGGGTQAYVLVVPRSRSMANLATAEN